MTKKFEKFLFLSVALTQGVAIAEVIQQSTTLKCLQSNLSALEQSKNVNEDPIKNWPPKNWKVYLDSMPLNSSLMNTYEIIEPSSQPRLDSEASVSPKGRYVQRAVSSSEMSPLISLDITDANVKAPILIRKLNASERSKKNFWHPFDRFLSFPKAAAFNNKNGGFNYIVEKLIPKFEDPKTKWSTELWPISLPNDVYQCRYFLKTSIIKENTIVEILDTAIFDSRREWLLSPLRQSKYKYYVNNINVHDIPMPIDATGWQNYIEREGLDAIKSGQERYLTELKQVLEFVLPDYVSRRGWSENFVRDLYLHAVQRRLSTRYSVVKKRLPRDLPGDTIASIGIDYAPYGAIGYIDRSTRKQFLRFAPISTGERDKAYIGVPNAGGLSFLKWGEPIPALGMERAENLPRPLVKTGKLEPVELSKDDYAKLRNGLPPDTNPDLSLGIDYYEGRIGEPTKFKVVPDLPERGVAYREVLSDLADSLFPRNNDPGFNLMGQCLYTYNPRREGVLLYGRMGFKVAPEVTPIKVEGEDWPVLSLTPTSLQAAKSSGELENEALARQLLDLLTRSTNRRTP